MHRMFEKIPGIVLCLLIAVPAWLAVEWIPPLEIMGAPVLAILTGMLLACFLPRTERIKPGISFVSKKILQAAVVLLGFGLNLTTVGKIGLTSLPVILSTISISLITAYVLHRLMKVPGRTAVLIGVGSSICGGSAIAATAPVIEADDDEIAQAISVIFLFNVIAAVIFPGIGSALGLSNEAFGLFAGTAINDTSSVTAAASTWDTIHGTGGTVLEYATVVKLTRTLAIIPITLVLSVRHMRQAGGSGPGERFHLKSILPVFVLYFVLAAVLTTVLTSVCSGTVLSLANRTFSLLKKLSKFFIVMAMAAIGYNTDFVKLVKTGKKPILLGFCCWISIISVSLLFQLVLFI